MDQNGDDVKNELEVEELPPTQMHLLAYDSSWSSLLVRLTEHPEEGLQTVDDTSWMNGYYQIPLEDLLIESSRIAPIHIICTRQGLPPSVLQAYLEAQPDAIRLETRDGRRPLHMACYSNQSIDVIQILAEADPNTLSRKEGFDGWTPFHICAYLPTAPNVIPMMLHVAGSERQIEALASQDNRSRTPLAVACSKRSKISITDLSLLYQATPLDSTLSRPMLEELTRAYHDTLLQHIKSNPLPQTSVCRTKPSSFCNPSKSPFRSFCNSSNWRTAETLTLRTCFDKMLVLLGVTEDDDLASYPVLHECIRQDHDCKTYFFHSLLRVNAFYACHVDSNGDLPLHVAAQYATETNPWAYRLRQLVGMYPRGAAIANRHGELPLEILHKRNLPWSHMSSILLCCPAALSKLQLSENAYTKILAKLDRTRSKTVMYVILKETPNLFDHSS